MTRSPRWGASTKLVVALVFIALVALVARRFAELFSVVVVAVGFAYVLNPPVTYITRRFKISRGLAVALVYLLLIVVLAGGSTALGFAIQRQIVALDDDFNVQELLADLPERIQTVLRGRVVVGPLTIILDPADTAEPVTTPFVVDLSTYDLQPLYDQALEAVRPVLSQTGRIVTDLASAAATTLGWALFVLVIGFYMLVDAPRLGQSIEGAAVPGYEADLRRLLLELGQVWNAFLRGQLLLALVIGVITTLAMTALGLRNALIVGLIAGALEFIPILGPFIAGAIGVAVALFQPVNPFGLSTLWYAVAILVAFLVIQQVENNVLVPRIIGESLNLHPLAVLIVAVMGATVAGIFGLLLAAPVLATLRLVGGYAYRKFFDLEPWPDPPPEPDKANRLLPWPFRSKPRRPQPPEDLPRTEYSYRVFWTKVARNWDAERRQAMAQAVAVVVAGDDFEANAYGRRYTVAGLDDQAHSGQSLIALQKVLVALEASAERA